MKTLTLIFISLLAFQLKAQDITVVAPNIFVCSLQIDPHVVDALEFPDFEAQFPGGENALKKYIIQNIQYPQVALENQEQGTVYVQFSIGLKGELEDVTVVKGVSESLDRETKRLIRNMPNWQPAEQKGKRVKSLIRLPVEFILN
jgi:protein TonB